MAWTTLFRHVPDRESGGGVRRRGGGRRARRARRARAGPPEASWVQRPGRRVGGVAWGLESTRPSAGGAATVDAMEGLFPTSRDSPACLARCTGHSLSPARLCRRPSFHEAPASARTRMEPSQTGGVAACFDAANALRGLAMGEAAGTRDVAHEDLTPRVEHATPMAAASAGDALFAPMLSSSHTFATASAPDLSGDDGCANCKGNHRFAHTCGKKRARASFEPRERSKRRTGLRSAR